MRDQLCRGWDDWMEWGSDSSVRAGGIVDSLAWAVEISYFDRFFECFNLASINIMKGCPRWKIERDDRQIAGCY